MFDTDLDQPDVRTHDLKFGLRSPRAVRNMVSHHAAAADLPDEASDRLRLVFHELVTNSVLHGGGAGLLRVWRTPGALICQVQDEGRIEDPLAGRRQPQPTDERGRGR